MSVAVAELRIADDLVLPLDAVTQAIAVLARRGSGKTYLGKVLAEEMVSSGLQVVILDPLGAFFGLRSSADGQGDGLPITIVGGEHGDVPLEPTAGKVIADVCVESPGSMIVDLSAFESNAAQDRFVTDFAERLYRAKGSQRRPLHLIVDEADSFAPQRPQPGQQRMLGAFEAIVRRGRIRGLGVTLITQRPAVLNKNVLTQVECLVAMQITSPQDRAAIDEWVKGNGTAEERAEVLGSLASFERGEAWFWSPSWLRILQRVKVRQAWTFDSSRTPEAGATVSEPEHMAPVDLDVLRNRIAATIERAKADDPKELRKRIVELERQLKASPKNEPQIVERVVRVEVPVIPEAFKAKLLRGMANIQDGLSMMIEAAEREGESVTLKTHSTPADFGRAFEALAHHEPVPLSRPQTRAENENHVAPNRQLEQNGKLTEDPSAVKQGITGPQQRILDALASFEAFGIAQPSRSNVAVFAGVSSTSGAYANNVSRLNVMRLLCYPGTGLLALTDEGRGMANPAQRFDSVERLHEAWYAQLTRPQAAILTEAIGRYPGSIERSELADVLGVSATSGAYANNLSRLHVLGVLDYPSKGTVRATELLFPEVGS